LTPEEKIKFDEILNSSEGITDVSQLTPALVETIKMKREPAESYYWSSTNNSNYQEHVKAIQKSLKEITYTGAETVVVSEELFYENGIGTRRYRIVVNGNELWDVGVGFNGKIWESTPGWKVSDNFNKGE
jgi:hypothetical protein